jgi:hypothetical protein
MKAFVLLILALLVDTNARPAEISSDVGVPVPARVFGARQVSDPLDRRFPRIPLKVAVDISSVEGIHPGIEAWAAAASNLCEQWYSVVCTALGENDVPQQVVLRVIAGTGGHADGNVITIGVEESIRLWIGYSRARPRRSKLPLRLVSEQGSRMAG